jgi:hypothetical protein
MTDMVTTDSVEEHRDVLSRMSLDKLDGDPECSYSECGTVLEREDRLQTVFWMSESVKTTDLAALFCATHRLSTVPAQAYDHYRDTVVATATYGTDGCLVDIEIDELAPPRDGGPLRFPVGVLEGK